MGAAAYPSPRPAASEIVRRGIDAQRLVGAARPSAEVPTLPGGLLPGRSHDGDVRPRRALPRDGLHGPEPRIAEDASIRLVGMAHRRAGDLRQPRRIPPARRLVEGSDLANAG